eukprot:symbB.v1.2.041487.t1/scaffold8269.1/size7005/1
MCVSPCLNLVSTADFVTTKSRKISNAWHSEMAPMQCPAWLVGLALVWVLATGHPPGCSENRSCEDVALVQSLHSQRPRGAIAEAVREAIRDGFDDIMEEMKTSQEESKARDEKVQAALDYLTSTTCDKKEAFTLSFQNKDEVNAFLIITAEAILKNGKSPAREIYYESEDGQGCLQKSVHDCSPATGSD